MVRSSILLVSLILMSWVTKAQQATLYSQYMFNGLAINPAYAGSSEALNFTATGRKQWSGVEGAPSTLTFSAHAPIRKEKMALGALITNDHISVFTQTTLNVVYAYRLHFTSGSTLAFGLQAGASNYLARYSDLTYKAANDPTLQQEDYNTITPGFGAGIYYNSKKFYAGASVPYLASNFLASKYVANRMELKNHYFFTAGYVTDINENLKFKPSTLIKYIEGAPVQIDYNANFLYKEFLWLGVSYRSKTSLIFLAQVYANDQLSFGYSYDHSLSKLSGFNTGSHEIMISYLFSYTKTKVVTPRYF
ncbi:type IX secretion system membrane protein PorP/SprF [Sporocytophaga sp.]|uniref:PorP/SprF family type IX secretion system membrane protein n=1 Tax=Sporocytophaga sp. TaxID=2231183 RepID=UPI0025EA1990|nr:type IX secretion system membrane protein PorP/SprF [Sporocytophaga sp.]